MCVLALTAVTGLVLSLIIGAIVIGTLLTEASVERGMANLSWNKSTDENITESHNVHRIVEDVLVGYFPISKQRGFPIVQRWNNLVPSYTTPFPRFKLANDSNTILLRNVRVNHAWVERNTYSRLKWDMLRSFWQDRCHEFALQLESLSLAKISDAKVTHRVSRLWVYGSRFLDNSRSQPSAFVNSEIFRRFIKCFLRQIGGVPSGFRRLLNFGKLSDDLSELTSHYLQLPVINQSNTNSNSDRTNLKDNFPEWCWIGAAVGAFSLMCYGWWHLRNEVRLLWGFCWWSIGATIWGYTVYVLIFHNTGTP